MGDSECEKVAPTHPELTNELKRGVRRLRNRMNPGHQDSHDVLRALAVAEQKRA